jgi:hypothetical protein
MNLNQIPYKSLENKLTGRREVGRPKKYERTSLKAVDEQAE